MYKIESPLDLATTIDGDQLAGFTDVKPDIQEVKARESGRAVMAVLRLLKIKIEKEDVAVNLHALESIEAAILKASVTGELYRTGRDASTINKTDATSKNELGDFLTEVYMKDKLNILKDDHDNDCVVIVAATLPEDVDECMILVGNRVDGDYIRVTGFQVKFKDDFAFIVPWAVYIGISKKEGGHVDVLPLNLWESEHLIGNGVVEGTTAKDEQDHLIRLTILLLYYVNKNWRETEKYGDGMQYIIIAGPPIQDRLNEIRGTLH